MSVLRRDLERVLERAERAVALSARCCPLNAQTEQQRLLDAWRRGLELAPAWVYAQGEQLDPIRAGLEQVASRARALGPWGRLHAERAEELGLEAELGQLVGTREFARVASRRHPVDPTAEGERAAEWAAAWSSAGVEPDLSPLHASDDPRDPDSLLSAMQRAVGARRLPFQVVARPDLLSAAATGDGVILVRAAAQYRARDVRRIVLHEIEGHALPRARAKAEALGLFALGTRGGSDDEEGRALLLEQRFGHLDALRRAELGRRHTAALSVRAGATFVDTARALRAQGAGLEEALTVAARVHRGGGLARELVYLPAVCRVGRAFEVDPEAERWLERGRIAVAAVAELRQLGQAPDRLVPVRAA